MNQNSKQEVIRIAITGPESTGKSELAEKLAAHYHTLWVPEYARAYINRLDRPYNRDDILKIARNQKRNENRIARRVSGLLFCDTEPIVTKIWSEVRYGTCDPWIQDQIAENNYTLFLLCDIDLPWQWDPLREHPHMRKELFALYLDELEQRGFRYFVVSGSGEERLGNAIGIIEKNVLHRT